MAFIGDITAYLRKLKLTNYAENLESKPRHHVRRITFVSSILEDEFDADDVVKPLSEEDQELLSWQAKTENLQDDTEVREDLILLSGRLCPYKNISFTLAGKVTDRDSRQERKEPHPLSAYRHFSFRCAMLTEHSTSDGQVQLLFSYDGLRDREFLRWRSHDYIKLVIPEDRPSYRVFWLVQWDIVDMLDPICGGLAATTDREIINSRLRSDHLARDWQGDSTGKNHNFHGIRYDAKRKSPWIAQVRPKSNLRSKHKMWLGTYPTPATAARAADAGHYYYNYLDRLNFLDSPSHLEKIPGDRNDKDMENFVKLEARRLAKIPPSGPEQSVACEPSLPRIFTVLVNPEDNSEQDILNAWGELSDANDSGLHIETESQTTSQGLDSSPGLVAEYEGAEWTWDSCLIDCDQTWRFE